MHHYFSTLDTMSQYPNALGAMFADQLINNASTESCAPVMAAVARDLKQYMRLRQQAIGQRMLLLGSGTGGGKIVQDAEILEYLMAGEGDGSLDFWTVSTSPANDCHQLMTWLTVQILRLKYDIGSSIISLGRPGTVYRIIPRQAPQLIHTRTAPNPQLHPLSPHPLRIQPLFTPSHLLRRLRLPIQPTKQRVRSHFTCAIKSAGTRRLYSSCRAPSHRRDQANGAGDVALVRGICGVEG